MLHQLAFQTASRIATGQARPFSLPIPRPRHLLPSNINKQPSRESFFMRSWSPIVHPFSS